MEISLEKQSKALARQKSNPFLRDVTQDPWENGFPELESLHKDTLDSLLELVASTKQNPYAGGLLRFIIGSPGSGKTALLGRLRRALKENYRAPFVYVYPFVCAQTSTMYLVKQVFKDLLRKEKDDGSSYLQEIVLGWYQEALRVYFAQYPEQKSSFSTLFQASQSIESLSFLFSQGFFVGLPSPVLEHILDESNIPQDVLSVLLSLPFPEKEKIASLWLKGNILEERQIQLLCPKKMSRIPEALFPEENEQNEEKASQILVSLSQFLKERGPLVLCFDQIESYSSPELIKALEKLVFHISNRMKNTIALVFGRTDIGNKIKTHMEPAAISRLMDYQYELKYCDEQQAMELIERRLEWVFDGQERPFLYPFPQEQIQSFLERKSRTPREIIQFANHLYQIWLKQESLSPEQVLQKAWEKAKKKACEDTPVNEIELWQDTLKIHLKKLEGILIRNFQEISSQNTIFWTFKIKSKKAGIAFLTRALGKGQALSSSLSHTLSGMIEEKIPRLLLLRPEKLGFRGKVCLEYKKKLEEKGALYQEESQDDFLGWIAFAYLVRDFKANDVTCTNDRGEEIKLTLEDWYQYLEKNPQKPFSTIEGYLKKLIPVIEADNTAITLKSLYESTHKPPGYITLETIQKAAEQYQCSVTDIVSRLRSEEDWKEMGKDCFLPVGNRPAPSQGTARIWVESKEAGSLLHEVISTFLKHGTQDVILEKSLKEAVLPQEEADEKQDDDLHSSLWKLLYFSYFLPVYHERKERFSPETFCKLSLGLQNFVTWFQQEILAEVLLSVDRMEKLRQIVVSSEESLCALWNENIYIQGRYDFLIHDPVQDSFVVVDFKLSDYREKNEDFLQLALYQWLLKKNQGIVAEGWVVFLGENPGTYKISAQDLEKLCQSEALDRFIREGFPTETSTEIAKTSIEPPSLTPLAPFVKIRLGKSSEGMPLFWNPSELPNPHIILTGQPGSGKTQSLMTMVTRLWQEHRVPSLLFDFQGEYKDKSDFIQETQAQVISIIEEGIHFNPLDPGMDTDHPGRRLNYRYFSYEFVDSIHNIFSQIGIIQRSLLQKAIVDAFEKKGFTSDPDTWNNDLPNLQQVKEILQEQSKERDGNHTNIDKMLAQLNLFFEETIFQKEDRLPFERLLKQVTILQLTGPEQIRLCASRFLLDKLYSYMISKGISQKIQVVFVVDEAHKLCSEAKIRNFAREARKYGIVLVLASQDPKDFHRNIASNANTFITLQLAQPGAYSIARSFGIFRKSDQEKLMQNIMSLSTGKALLRNNTYNPYTSLTMDLFYQNYPIPKEISRQDNTIELPFFPIKDIASK